MRILLTHGILEVVAQLGYKYLLWVLTFEEEEIGLTFLLEASCRLSWLALKCFKCYYGYHILGS